MLHVQDLVLLGLLKESPKHGYEIKQVVDERMQRIARITSGTVYYTLRKLEKKGFVTKTRARSGRRPEKYVYQITTAGDEEFSRLHRESFFAPDTVYSAFNAGLYFIRYANFTEVLEAIDTRLKELDDVTLDLLREDADKVAEKMAKAPPTGPKAKYTKDDKSAFEAAVELKREELLGYKRDAQGKVVT